MLERINDKGHPASHSEIAEQNTLLAKLESERDEAVSLGEQAQLEKQKEAVLNKVAAIAVTNPQVKEVLNTVDFKDPNYTIDEVGHLGLQELDTAILDLERLGDYNLANELRASAVADYSTRTL